MLNNLVGYRVAIDGNDSFNFTLKKAPGCVMNKLEVNVILTDKKELVCLREFFDNIAWIRLSGTMDLDNMIKESMDKMEVHAIPRDDVNKIHITYNNGKIIIEPIFEEPYSLIYGMGYHS